MKLLAAIITFAALCIVVAAWSAGSFLVVDETVKPADFCHVLSGNRKRVDFSAELYAKGFCDKVVFIGGDYKGGPSYASKQRDYALTLGISERDVVIDETNVYSTFVEMERLAAVIGQRLSPSLIVSHITDAYHSRRVHMVSDWTFGDRLQTQVVSVPFDDSYFAETWWKNARTRKMVISEYAKIAYYWLRHFLSFPPLDGWLAQLETLND